MEKIEGRVGRGGIGGKRILFEFTKYINTNIRFHILVVGLKKI